jgi:hypothetical protein
LQLIRDEHVARNSGFSPQRSVEIEKPSQAFGQSLEHDVARGRPTSMFDRQRQLKLQGLAAPGNHHRFDAGSQQLVPTKAERGGDLVE